MRKHGHAKNPNSPASPTYRSWSMMIQRCTNPRFPAYARYGAVGIGFDPAWAKFSNFLADMGERLPGTSLDRIDNKLGYSRQNCRWATRIQQMRNKTNNTRLTINGETRCLAEWEQVLGVNRKTLQRRLAREH